MDRAKLERLASLWQALRNGNFDAATLREFRQLVTEAAQPQIEAAVARERTRRAAIAAGTAAGRAAGRAEYARQQARRNMTNRRR